MLSYVQLLQCCGLFVMMPVPYYWFELMYIDQLYQERLFVDIWKHDVYYCLHKQISCCAHACFYSISRYKSSELSVPYTYHWFSVC